MLFHKEQVGARTLRYKGTAFIVHARPESLVLTLTVLLYSTSILPKGLSGNRREIGENCNRFVRVASVGGKKGPKTSPQIAEIEAST